MATKNGGFTQKDVLLLIQSSIHEKRVLHMPCVDWSGMDLRGVNLRNANLRFANLSGCNLQGADLENANVGHESIPS